MPIKIQVEQEAARLSALSINGISVGLSAEGGGFSVYDATNKEAIAFPTGSITKQGGTSVFACETSDIRLHAEFVSHGGHVLVTGEIENMRRDDRGVVLDYCVPLNGQGLAFSNALDESVAIGDSTSKEGNAVPIAAMCTKTYGVAMAIPPSEPCIFGMEGRTHGLTTRFYLGLSPDTLNFPNLASFAFVIYGVDPASGFRSALDRYYSLFSDRYTPRVECHGMWMSQLEGRTPPNIEQYGYDMLEMLEITTKDDIARDTTHGVLTYPYILVGQREIKYLDKLPENDAEAMAVYAKWSPSDQAGRPLVKENIASRGDINLKAEVASSACIGPDGKNIITLRDTFWGGKSITFTVNPNPDLFRDTREPTVGGTALELVAEWLIKYPEMDGVLVDSLGPRWPAVLNYRHDHFRYARYPLTVDPKGRVALHNELSHYEFLERLLESLPEPKKSLAANGIKGIYRSRPIGTYRKHPEHYRGEVYLDRFFMASLLDIAGGETGINATTELCRQIRTTMGKKPYAFLNYHWGDAAVVETFLNRCLCYAIFGSNTRNPFTGDDYLENPQGYQRDRELLDWYIPKARLLSRAGWEPITNATVTGENVYVERFGKGSSVYFSVFNDGKEVRNCIFTADLGALGFKPGRYSLNEIARETPLVADGAGRVSFSAAPLRCYILALKKIA